jgi:hypothetical protein
MANSSTPDSAGRDARGAGDRASTAIRTADVLGALSLAGDLAVGLPAEHGLRSCLIAMQLAEHLAMPAWERITVYYTSLLMDAGCTAWTSQIAKRMLTDEIVARRELVFHTDIRNPEPARGIGLGLAFCWPRRTIPDAGQADGGLRDPRARHHSRGLSEHVRRGE